MTEPIHGADGCQASIAACLPVAACQTAATAVSAEPVASHAVQGAFGASQTGGNPKRPYGDVKRIVLTALADPDTARWSNSEIARLISVSASSVDRYRDMQPDMRPRLPSNGCLRLCRRGNAIYPIRVNHIGSSSHG